jgi:AraC-like DNA-binding protein
VAKLANPRQCKSATFPDALHRTIRRFTDPDEYAASVLGRTMDILLLGNHREFSATIIDVALKKLHLQRGIENCPRVAHTVSSDTKISVSFLEHVVKVSPLAGLRDASNAMSVYSPGNAYSRHVNGPITWCTVSLPAEDFAETMWTLTGKERPPAPGTGGHFYTDHPALQHLRYLHATTLELAVTTPQVLADQHVASGLEQALVSAMATCVAAAVEPPMSVGERRHRQIIDRFEATLARMPVEPLYLSDICAAIGVSARTMEYCCREYYGMGPNRYLRLRRMNLARRALIDADPDKMSVTDVAMRFGFWELGRFASAYRSLFAETPSVTLRRSREPYCEDGAQEPRPSISRSLLAHAEYA